MQTPTEIAQEIVEREGGYVHDKDDPGGPTKYGVTLGTMRRLGLDLDGDGDIDIDDVKLLTIPEAVDLFLEHYYRKPKIDRLASKYPVRGLRLRSAVFDMQVNSGINAVKILQRLSVRCGIQVSVDGAIGRNTFNAINQLCDRGVEDVADAYGVARRAWYYRLGDRRVKSRKYCVDYKRGGVKGGWIKRSEEFVRAAEISTLAEHRQRVRAWGL